MMEGMPWRWLAERGREQALTLRRGVRCQKRDEVGNWGREGLRMGLVRKQGGRMTAVVSMYYRQYVR